MILGFYGPQNSGKTTLIENLVTNLRDKYHIVTVKKIHDQNFSIDTKGKDTSRHSTAGAQLVVAAAAHETTFIVNGSMDLEKIIASVQLLNSPDIIFVEGFKDAMNIPKVMLPGAEKTIGTVMEYDGKIDEVTRYIESRVKSESVNSKITGLRLLVNGQQVTMGKFASDVILGAILGMVGKLKDIPQPTRTIKLEITI